jgi:hypothetical protein
MRYENNNSFVERSQTDLRFCLKAFAESNIL